MKSNPISLKVYEYRIMKNLPKNHLPKRNKQETALDSLL